MLVARNFGEGTSANKQTIETILWDLDERFEYIAVRKR